MSSLKINDIVGYGIGEDIVCPGCLTELKDLAITEDDVILQAGLDDEYVYFCDRCKLKL